MLKANLMTVSILKKKRKIFTTCVDRIVFLLCKFKNLESTVISVELLHFAIMVSYVTVSISTKLNLLSVNLK